MIIPATVAGRPVSNRGVHLAPFGFSGYWCSNKETRDYWLKLLQDMGMSWCVLITESDSCLEVFDGKPVVLWLLEAGVIPLIRWQAAIDRVFTGEDVVKKLVPIYKSFGLRPFLQLYNEPLDDREWSHGVPADAWRVFINRWNQAAGIVIRAGGHPGFPDGPGYNFTSQHPFSDTTRGYWDDGHAWYGVHNYGKGRPIAYPYDDVSERGTPLTEVEYREALDEFADDPAWHDLPLEVINKQRREWAAPGMLEDDVCWRGWELIAHHSEDILGYTVPMAMTEGGWQVRDRAGSGEHIDIRWPMTTPKMVARKTLDMFNAPSPMFAQCPWLLACADMGGSGWEYDSWVGWAFSDLYGREKPVVQILKANSCQPQPTSTVEHLRNAELNITEALSYLV